MNRSLLSLALALSLCFAFILPPAARPLEAERAQELVGDQADGYLGVVAGGSPAWQAEVANINAQRAQQYAEIAKQRGTSPTAVGAVTGQTLYDQTPAGQYFRDSNGNWIRKP